MKKAILSVLLLGGGILGAQTLPQTINSGPYIFEKQWLDNFNQKESRWNFADWTFEHNECEFNQTAGSFDNGKLKLSILKKTAGNMGEAPSKPYWGAEYWSSDEYLYGRYVISMKPYTPSGTVTSFFTSYIKWNEDYTIPLEWHEIDIEFAGKTNQVEFTLHWIDATGKHQDSHIVPLSFDASNGFHEWAVEWTPTFIKYYVDNQLLFTFDDPDLLAEQNHSQQIQMNYWVSDSEAWVGAFNPALLPIVTEYDYMAYYKLTNPLVTPVKSNTDSVIRFFPNPVDKSMHIEGIRQHTPYKLFSIDGKLLEEGFTEDGMIYFKSSMDKGLYVLEVFEGEKITKIKVSGIRY